jgi:hypothetical protein
MFISGPGHCIEHLNNTSLAWQSTGQCYPSLNGATSLDEIEIDIGCGSSVVTLTGVAVLILSAWL